jgi:hypothetical protein
MPDERDVDEALSGQRIAALADLKSRLGAPGTIVCLGNGPSSEDARIASYDGAALFRVNWIWLDRGWMVAPDVVFTGDPDVLRLAREPIVIFPTAAEGTPILRGYGAARRARLPGYAFLDRFEPGVADMAAARIPTNGALMVAVAALLRPSRLVVAGIDLYRHPCGKYPGPADNADGYTSRHGEDIDLELIGRALRDFRGDLHILSDNLCGALSTAAPGS